MTSNQIGPDKGLLDMVFGKKETAAQASDAVTTAADGKDATAKQVPEDFMAMLAKAAQDQKDAAAASATAQTKGESKQVTKSAGATDAAKKEAAALLAKQKGKAGETGTQLKDGAKETAEEEQKARAKALGLQGSTAAQAGVLQAQAKVKSEAEQAALQGAAGPKALPANAAMQAMAAKSATPAAGGVPGVGGGNSGQAAVMAAQQAAVAAQQAAVTAQQAAQMALQQGQAQTVVQPIVIQMPMAIPVEVLGVEEGELDHFDMGGAMGSASGGSKAQLTSSQDFLAQLGIRQGSVLGVDRVDPRLGRLNDESQNENSKDANFSMMMPQLNGQHGQYGSDTKSAASASGSVQVTVGENGKPMLANTMGLANEVATLAAQGGGEVRVRIVPENLGEMTISVKTEGQHLNVQIETASSAARDAVASAMPELRQMLTASHYKVGSLEVNHAAAGGQVMMGQTGDAVGMSQWSNQSSFSDWQGGHQDNHQGGSAWDRYQSQQEARQEAKQQQQYRQQSGYKRYQQEQLGA